MKITGNEPSCPISEAEKDRLDQYPNISYPGLSIRQQFAMAAMQGIFSNADSLETHAKIANKVGVSHEVVIARCSFDMADAMIEENNRREDNE